jgi:general secretion pathway protein M
MMQKLNNKQQRWLAVGLLVGIIILLCAVIFIPWYSAFKSTVDEFDDLMFRVKRYERVIASRDEVLREVEQGREKVNALGYFYTQETSSLVAAELQKRIKAIVQRAGGDITSTQVLPHKDRDELLQITVKVRLSGDMEMLRSLLYDIEVAKPLLTIEEMNITPKTSAFRRRNKAKKNAQNDKVTVTLQIAGYMRKEL